MKGFFQGILQDIMKNIIHLVNETIVPSTQLPSISYCRLSNFEIFYLKYGFSNSLMCSCSCFMVDYFVEFWFNLSMDYFLHCKPKPCKAYKELPVSQFSQGKTCFHYREPLFSLQGPYFHYRDFPYTSLLGIAVFLSLVF
jgi:hypothetical protein